jgi:hypothetical protein
MVFGNLFFGIVFLILAWPVGNFLARVTKDEMKQGRKWFKLLVLVGLIGGFVGLILGNDVLLFTMFFIVIVSSRSLSSNFGR